MTYIRKPNNSHRYMADFGLLRDSAIAGGAGAAYGVLYTRVKQGMGAYNNPEELKQETAANTVAGIGSGLATAGLANLLKKR